MKSRLLEAKKDIKVREIEGEYKFDNPDLEEKSMSKRIRKTKELEAKYKDRPKIAFHQLTDEGNRLFMQAKRDKVWTTLTWSFSGNIAGLFAVSAMEQSRRWQNARFVKRNELTKVAVFLGCVGIFTAIGYGNARQDFVRTKHKIVETHSIASSDK